MDILLCIYFRVVTCSVKEGVQDPDLMSVTLARISKWRILGKLVLCHLLMCKTDHP